MKQLEDRFRYLQLALANTFESGEKLKLVQEMNDLQYRGRELQLQQLTQRAYTDDNALNQLVGLYTAGSGNPIGAQRLANGTIQLINQKGQAIAPPMTRQQLAVSLYNGVSDAQRNKNADLANKVREKAALTDAEAGAKHPYTMAQEQQKGVNSANTALIHAEGGIVGGNARADYGRRRKRCCDGVERWTARYLHSRPRSRPENWHNGFWRADALRSHWWRSSADVRSGKIRPKQMM